MVEVCESDHESEILDAGLRAAKLGATIDVCNATWIDASNSRTNTLDVSGADIEHVKYVHRCHDAR